MDETTTTATTSTAIDELDWDGWDLSPAEVCSIENGADCTACEG
ncbi:hypothetical protein [Phycicoccus avicenniae]|nr:hypothetical protein [Phycicoccus avicenniae]